MRSRVPATIALLALFGWMSAASYADDATIDRNSTDSHISKLLLRSHTKILGRSTSRYVILDGLYAQKGWTLYVGKARLRLDQKGYFKIKTKLPDDEKVLSFIAKGPNGEIQNEDVRLVAGSGESSSSSSQADYTPQRHHFFLGVGGSSLSYTQAAGAGLAAVSLNEEGVTLKGTYDYRFAQNWDLGFSLFGTGAVLSSNLSGVTARFLGLNFRAGYSVIPSPSPWSLLLMFGGYYTTMSVSPNEFGFKNLTGPEVYPVLSYTFSKGDRFSTYFKYAAVSAGGLSFLSGSDEIALGFAYHFRLKSGNSIPITFDYANLKTSLVPESTGSSSSTTTIGVTSSSVTIGTGYEF